MLSFVVWLFHMLLSLFVPASLWIFFFFKQKTAYEMRISDWSSDVCSSDLHFFSRQDGQIYTVASIYRWFRKILYRAGISHGGIGTGPRIHDFRHTFACHSLAQMSRAGLDLYYSLPLLSTYMGHRSLSATDGYVRLTEHMYPGLPARVNSL